MRHIYYIVWALIACIGVSAAELRPPGEVKAGTAFSIAADGDGTGTFYLIGPAGVVKRQVSGGSPIEVKSDEVAAAGRYSAVLCAGSNCSHADFWVTPSEPARLSFLVHPSRVPVATPNSISAVAIVFDKYRNLVWSRRSVTFKVEPQEGSALTQARPTQDGLAWISLSSSPHGGTAKVGVSIAGASELRVVQQVASEACRLTIRSSWGAKALLVETEPVRDCSGNVVSDGTVISFTKVDSSGRTTVDAPVKKGVAKVEMPVAGSAQITVASGIATGNELNVAGRR